MRPCSLTSSAILIALVVSVASVSSQLRVQPVADRPGAVSLELLLRKLRTVGTFMQTTAHPDDEDNVLLSKLGHGEGMRTVLVSATRGEGGQNEIGPELFEALSLLRTQELESVHRFDGAEQFFTRAIDFGFSFSIDENIEKWGRDAIVGDYVRHIRATRPHVVAAFVCGGEGGGQAHQASTVLTLEAVKAAADPSRFQEHMKEGLRPWQVLRTFCTEGFRPEKDKPLEPDLIAVDDRMFEPLLGLTYGELGTEARSMHKCQGTSQLLPLPGESVSRVYRLRQDASGMTTRPLKHMFEGLDMSLGGLARAAGGDGPVAGALRDVAAAATAGDAANGLRLVRQLRARLERTRLTDAAHYEIDFRMAQKERQFEQALLLSRGIDVEAIADDGVVTARQPLKITAFVADRGAPDLDVRRVVLGGVSTTTMPCWGKAEDGPRTCTVETRVADLAPTSIYWKARTDAARYDFAPGVPFGAPFAPSPFQATFELVVAGHPIRVVRPIEFRYGDIVAGEKRMELHVVPQTAVSLEPSIAVIPAQAKSDERSRTVRVTVANNAKGAASGAVQLSAPAQWSVTPRTAAVNFSREDEAHTVTFRVAPPAGVAAGEYRLAVVHASAADVVAEGYQIIDYAHVRRRHIVRGAVAQLKVIDAKIAPNLRVGYVVGVGDQVPQAIEQLGAAVQMIDAQELAAGDLSKYDVIVTGVRAYERRADLRANNHRLLAYAQRGGTVLVQYNKFEFNEAQYGPFPAKVSSNRITDENAPVEILVPSHAVFNRPNRIDAREWQNWVQERGLYFLGDRDARYVDLVRMTDPFAYNAGAKTGALVEAKVGRGRWMYIGLGLWRQLPAGTEGAYKLLANLLSLGARRP